MRVEEFMVTLKIYCRAGKEINSSLELTDKLLGYQGNSSWI